MTPRALSFRAAQVVRVLIVDDELKLRESLAEGLRLENWSVATAENGTEALRLVSSERFDLLILDLLLPDTDGFEILRQVRARDPLLPVLMITAHHAHSTRFAAFASDTADLVTKPFGFADLLARCRALLAPAQSPAGKPTYGGLELDHESRVVYCGGQQITLTGTESALLEFLLRNPGVIVTPEMLARAVWKESVVSTPLKSAIEFQVEQLGRKLGKRTGIRLILTVQGIGYRLESAARLAVHEALRRPDAAPA